MKDRQNSLNIVYIPLRRRYKSHRGLAERLVKKRLKKRGWEVWRGGFIHALRKDELYPNVERKYKRLKRLMEPNLFEYLEYLSRYHHGMPDFLAYRRKFKFIECKLGHEQLNPLQKKCIPKLMNMGFCVEIFKLVFPCTKDRIAEYDIMTGDRIVREKQLRLKLNW